MDKIGGRCGARRLIQTLVVLTAAAGASRGLAQSPFETGASNLVDEFTAIATPFAVLLVMALGLAAMVGRISWGWPVAALVGICILFGAPQLVEWAQQLFGV